MPVTTQRFGYQPALDGVRAIAVTLVVLYHYPTPHSSFGANRVHGGFLGVDAFFVLSGFLITTLLLRERASSARVSLGNFYARRALRLLPALAVLLVIAGFLHMALGPKDPNRPQVTGLVSIVFYVANWVNIYRPRALGIAASTWSLAIEEQFYLVWPTILILLLGRRMRMRLRTLAIVTAAGIAASAGWSNYYWAQHRGHLDFSNRHAALVTEQHRLDAWNRIYFGSDTRAYTLLVGCLVAVLLFRLLPGASTRARTRLGIASALALVAIVAIVARAIVLQSGWLPSWGFLLFAIAVGILVAGLVAAPRSLLARGFGFAPLAWLGRRSYAVYLFHQLVFAYFGRSHVHLAPKISFAFQLIVILVVAEVSFRLVEAPMLRRKRRFEPAPVTVGSPQ